MTKIEQYIENLEDYHPASKVKRFFAFVIDLSIIFSIDWFLLKNQPSFYENYGFLLTLGLFLFKDCIKGQSIGKWLMNIKIIDIDNKTPFFLKLIFRNLFLLFIHIDFFVIFVNENNRRLADILCDTIVVKK